MKLKSLLFAAACTLAVTASAESFSPGKQNWPPTGSYSEGSSITLFDLSYSGSGSQNIYSQNELSAVQPKINADGSQDVAVITGVELPFYMGMAYALDGEATITAYLTPYDGASFPVSGTKSQWIAYNTENSVKGSASISAYDDDVLDAAYGEDMVTVSITFDKEFEYTADGFVLTVIAQSSLEDGAGNDYWFMGTYDYKPQASKCSAIVKGSTSMSGSINSSSLSNQLPVVNFTYTTVHKEAQGGGEVVGDPAVFSVGNYDGCSPETTSSGMSLPVSTEYDYTFAQVVYTPNELNGLSHISADGVVKADINDITFKMYCESDYLSGQISGKVYIQKYEGTGLPVVNGKAQWVQYDTSVYGEYESDYYQFDEFYDEGIEFKAVLNTPLRYEEGESLLLTFVSECPDFEGMYGDSQLGHYVFAGSGNLSAVKATDSAPITSLSGAANNVSKYVPVLKLGYNPVTVAATTKPILFDNVQLALEKATLDPSIIGWGGATQANTITISFDLVNAAQNDKYDIILGTANCGTITGSHGVLSFVPVGNGDLVLSVKPQTEGVMGGSTTIAAADIQALFPAPEVEVATDAHCNELKAAYAEYTVWETPGLNKTEPTKKTGVQIVAKFKMATNAPVATMRGTSSDNQVKVVTGRLDVDCFSDFTPAGEYSDYAANNGYISFYLNNSNVLSADIEKGELVAPATKTISVNFSMDYPLVSKAVPVLGTAAVSTVSTKDGFDKTTVTKKYNNGQSWSTESCSASFNFKAGDPEIVVDATYPDYLHMFENTATKTLDFYAPDTHVIHINWIPEVDEMPANPNFVRAFAQNDEDVEWMPVEGHVYSHPTTEPGTLMIKTKDAAGNDSSETMTYTIDKDGITTGVEAITVSGNTEAAEYFDLTGRRVANPSTGIYIVRQGKTVRKVVL